MFLDMCFYPGDVHCLTDFCGTMLNWCALRKMKKDPSGNKYYFNRDTSVSTFDVPEGLLSKEDYKALKKQVEEIRSKDPAGTWSDDDVPV